MGAVRCPLQPPAQDWLGILADGKGQMLGLGIANLGLGVRRIGGPWGVMGDGDHRKAPCKHAQQKWLRFVRRAAVGQLMQGPKGWVARDNLSW